MKAPIPLRLLVIPLALACAALMGPTAEARSNQEGAQTLAKLTKPLTVQIEETPFEDLVEFVRTTTGATVDIAWTTDRNPDGLDPEAPVSLDVQGAQALAVLLHGARQASVGVFDEPTWQLDEQTGALQLGPRSRLNKFKRLEIYDINDLTLVLPDYDDVPQLNLNAVVRQGQGGGGGGIFQQSQAPESDTNPEREAERIIEILQAVIEPDQWIANGGTGATVRLYEGNLLISAPDYIHRQINGYPFLAGPVARRPITASVDEKTRDGAVESSSEPSRGSQPDDSPSSEDR